MISQAEKSLSLLKKNKSAAQNELKNMYLAVYPYEIQFSSPVPFKTSLYFQKNYQVIGQLQQSLSPGAMKQKIQLTNIKNIIIFRLSSLHHIVYKWSIYQHDNNNQQQFLDSFPLDLHQIVHSFTKQKVNKSQTKSSQSQLVKSGFIKKQMRIKFRKIDITLYYNLYAAHQEQHIKQFVLRKFFHKQQDAVIEQNFLKTDSSMNIGLSSRKFPSNIVKKGSDPSGQYTLSNKPPLSSSSGFNNHNQPGPSLHPSNVKKDDQVIKATTSQNLQNIILNFDAAGTITQSKQLHIDSDHLQKTDPDMVFKDESKSNKNDDDTKTNQATINTQLRKDDTLFNSRDYGMLKLQSDQGRIRQDPLDKHLEMAQLQAIEEQKPSRQVTINTPLQAVDTGISPYQQRINKLKAKKKSTIRQQSLEPQLQPKPSSLKRIAIVFVFSLLLFFLAATMMDNKKKKDKNKGKNKKPSKK